MTEPNLQPPSKKLETKEYINKGSKTLLSILFVVIVCLVLIIFFLLLPAPQSHYKSQEQKENTIQTKADVKTQSNKEIVNSINKEFNENIKIEWMLRKTDAENIKLPIWSNKEYELAIDTANMGEQYKLEKKTELAENAYKKAINMFDEAVKEKKFKLQQLIAKANRSLEKENLIEAKNLLKKAQAIDPQEEKIIKRLFLIEHRGEVNQLYRQAIENEKVNKLAAAILNLEKALEIEPEYKKIEEKLAVLLEYQRERKFQNTISGLLTDLEKNKLIDAQQKLRIAKTLKSSDPIINELKTRINEKITNRAVAQLLKKGKVHEKNERWQAALIAYQEIKKYDPDANKAIINEQRVLLYIKFKKILDQILLNPERLQDNNVYNSLSGALDYIESEIKHKKNLLYPLDKTPILEKKIITAKKFLNDASKEISITIKSDNETDISIYKIGKLGKLKQKTLFLKPGSYTIVGTRKGYRDYRKKIKLESTDQSAMITVLCREKI